jgi:hypothetical protein
MTAVIGLATAGDDAAIRALLARNSVPGQISLTYRREPDYFQGCGPMGPFFQVLVARDGSDVTGLACRAVRPAFVNGREQPLGYLGQLRVDTPHRGRWFVSRGFRFLRELHADGRTEAYVTTIIEGNPAATGVLVKHPRRGMPRYRFLDRLHTLALVAGGGKVAHGAIRRAKKEDLPDIVAFLRAEGSRRQFFPALAVDDFETDVTSGLKADDFLLVTSNGVLAGVCALWDQSAYKQTVIDHYGGVLSTLRPLYNVVAPVLRRPRLPRPGSALRTAYASFLTVRDDDPAVLETLLRAVRAAAHQRGIDYVVAGFCQGDPHLATARRFPHIPYRSDIYTVAWDDGADFHDQLDGRPCYLDPATL